MASLVRVKAELQILEKVAASSVNHNTPKLYEVQAGRVITVWIPVDQYLWTLTDTPTEARFLEVFPFAHKVDQITP